MRERNNQLTSVIFRKYKSGGQIVAIFPNLDFSPDCDVMTYEHIGQHGGGDYKTMMKITVPASQAEAKPLKQELLRIGYKLRIVNRRTRTTKYKIWIDKLTLEKQDRLGKHFKDVTICEDSAVCIGEFWDLDEAKARFEQILKDGTVY